MLYIHMLVRVSGTLTHKLTCVHAHAHAHTHTHTHTHTHDRGRAHSTHAYLLQTSSLKGRTNVGTTQLCMQRRSLHPESSVRSTCATRNTAITHICITVTVTVTGYLFRQRILKENEQPIPTLFHPVSQRIHTLIFTLLHNYTTLPGPC